MEERSPLLVPQAPAYAEKERSSSSKATGAEEAPPKDAFHIAYLVYFTLGAGFLLPWNAFITAIDYFSYLYPAAPVDRVFSVCYMISCLIPLLFIVGWGAHRSSVSARINTGLALFTLSLLVVPVMDAIYVKGVRGLYSAYHVTLGAVVLAGVSDAFVQGGVIGAAGELPERYMQAVCAGTAASGVLVSAMRILTKAIFPQNAHGLRNSANLYFGVSIAIMIICIVCYNIVDKLPVVRYYKDIKLQAQNEERNEKGFPSGKAWRSILWDIIGRVKWFGIGIFLIYVVTLSIFPGYITEDVHSKVFNDWYPIILIAGYNLFDLVGKSLPAVYLLENVNLALAGCAARLLFYPLFLGCLHGPKFFRTEIPVTVLTCLLGLTNGYFTAIVLILAPKSVPIQHAETSGIVMVVFLLIGLAVGSLVSWFWVL
ncbi:hypothetical protein J5N97_007043 [Dioscorea zingiberensis]|uniref:Equilibrative nucleotide transporter 1 n=1 Tax=Dioscorea zingiberensis TaxID=325984 RepID=A0A9D5DEQ2_9LILI|nr:hypothetical protein J5N97_007043 [Dioscorea zingiberensis]